MALLADSVSLIIFNIETQVRKALNGEPNEASVESLLLYVGLVYLEEAKAAKAQVGDQKDIAQLDRLFKLEDPRA